MKLYGKPCYRNSFKSVVGIIDQPFAHSGGSYYQYWQNPKSEIQSWDSNLNFGLVVFYKTKKTFLLLNSAHNPKFFVVNLKNFAQSKRILEKKSASLEVRLFLLQDNQIVK